MNKKQLKLLKNDISSYGGDLLKTRLGRSRPRPLAVKSSIHLVLRSTKATGDWSFSRPKNKKKIETILTRFANQFSVRILMKANVGNHIHLHIKLANRHSYRGFIRAMTSAIMMAVTGASRWRPLSSLCEGKFWDRRPFTRIIVGFKDRIGLEKYIELNQLEGSGLSRTQGRYILEKQWALAP